MKRVESSSNRAKVARVPPLLFAFAVAMMHGCGAKDVKLPITGSDGGSNAAGNGGAARAGSAGAEPASGGTAEPGTGGTGGTGAQGAQGAETSGGDGGEPPPKPLCEDGALRCNGDTPQRCEAELWLDLDPCGGRTPACVNGVCASVKLVGGIMSMGTVNTTEDGAIRLVDHGFEYQETGTGMLDGRAIFVTGAVVP